MPKMHGPYDQIGWQGQTLKVGPDGAIDVPQEAVAELRGMGMMLGVPAAVAAPVVVAPVPMQAEDTPAPKDKGKRKKV